MILDLANRLINTLRRGTAIEFTGLRPGEKLHEVLIGHTEVGEVEPHPRITHTAGELADVADALVAVSELEVLEALSWPAVR